MTDNLRDHLVLLHVRVEVGKQGLNRAGNLGPHLHRRHRINGSRGLHHVLYVALLHFLRVILRRALALIAESRKQPNRCQQYAHDRPFVFYEFHRDPQTFQKTAKLRSRSL